MRALVKTPIRTPTDSATSWHTRRVPSPQHRKCARFVARIVQLLRTRGTPCHKYPSAKRHMLRASCKLSPWPKLSPSTCLHLLLEFHGRSHGLCFRPLPPLPEAIPVKSPLPCHHRHVAFGHQRDRTTHLRHHAQHRTRLVVAAMHTHSRRVRAPHAAVTLPPLPHPPTMGSLQAIVPAKRSPPRNHHTPATARAPRSAFSVHHRP